MLLLTLIREAMASGCRYEIACLDVGYSSRTIRRWEKHGGCDRRYGPKSKPKNALSGEERRRLLTACNEQRFADLTPRQIVPLLADEGVYIASEATMYRVLREEGLVCHRERSRPKRENKLQHLVATDSNQIWSWDITFLKSRIRGHFFKAYVFLDIFDRRLVGAHVSLEESADLASVLVKELCIAEGIERGQLTLHADNGGSMRGCTMLGMLEKLGVNPSFSRPGVSDDNPYSESNFRTMKYSPDYPRDGFVSLEEAAEWMDRFLDWYNCVHLHSGIRYVTPMQRYRKEDKVIMAGRDAVYKAAQARTPLRWSKQTRDWSYISAVSLNPDKKNKLNNVSSASEGL